MLVTSNLDRRKNYKWLWEVSLSLVHGVVLMRCKSGGEPSLEASSPQNYPVLCALLARTQRYSTLAN